MKKFMEESIILPELDINIEYYIIKRTAEYDERVCEIYGIEIIKNTVPLESACILDISVNEEYTRQLVKTLAQNKVTPITLFDILGDIIE